MKIFPQVRAVCAVNLRSLSQRLGASIVLVAGIAGAVGVLVTVLALGRGLEQSFANTGKPDRAIVTSKGALSEGSSSLQREVAFAAPDARGLKKNAQGKPVLSMEVLTQIRLEALSDGVLKNVSLRGIGPLALALRPEIRLVEGRMFRPGLHEIVVGVPLQGQFKHLALGDAVTIQGSPWTIVGSFESHDGGAHDSEIFADAVSLLSVFHRTNFQSITVQLQNADAIKPFAAALAANPSLSIEVQREDLYFAEQSKAIVRLLTSVGYVIGVIMAVGAVFAAMNTMYAAVSAQALFIATLRAIGFDAGAVLVAIFVEALALAVSGALVGTAIAWLLFSGHSINMLSSGQNQTIFALHISSQLAVLGVVWALVMGFAGGLFPAIRAARLPVVEALRAM